MTDAELLHDYTSTASQSAFSQLVSRHIGLVYAAALRQTRDRHLADDVCQAVFLILSQKAHSIRPNIVLAAWLYKTTRYAAANAMRLKAIRLKHESNAAEMTPMQTAPENEWSDLEPLLDDAVSHLGTTDRQVVLLHYFQGATLAQVASTLGLSPDAASKRLQRAIVKLRSFFSRHGASVSAVAVTEFLLNSHASPPDYLTHSIASAFATGTAAQPAAAFSTLVAKGATHMMFMTHLKAAAAVAATVLVLIGGSVVAIDQTLQAAPPPAHTAAPSPAPAAAAATLPTTPLAALKELARACREGDAPTVEQFIHGATPDEKRVIHIQALSTTTVFKFKKAFGEAYGKKELDKLGPMVFPTTVPASTKVTVNGDKAVINYPGLPIPLEMVRVEDTWKLPYSFLASSALPLPPDQMVAWLEKTMGVMDEMTLAISLGEFKTAAEATTALRQRMVAMAQSAAKAPAAAPAK